ncbi:SurA N-terminal domain-containing protein [Hyphomonas sp.]|uniref:peptidylprolyl isomerase n=1 Tax=Hyphomonas sp. TaxID=87 RepID=UPI0039193BBA
MLASMKNLLRTPVGKLILMIMIVGMAAWGVDEFFNQLRGGVGGGLARAGTRTLEPADFDRRVEAILRDINTRSDKAVTKSDALESGLIDQVLTVEKERLILLGYADSIGLLPSAEAAIQQISSITAFQNPLTGELDPTVLRDRLGQLGMTPAQFERQVKDDILIDLMRTGTSSAVVAPQSLVSLQARFLAETRDVAWFFYDASTAEPPAAPTDEEIRAFYDANIEALRIPERRALDVLLISADDFTGQVEVTEQEIATIYEATKSEQFSEPDQRTFVEMYFPTRDLARNGFGLLAGGADPNTVPGSSSLRLRTGRAADVTDEALREAMFGRGRQSGAMFGPRETPNGWLVTRLISVQPGAVRPLEEVAEGIRLNLARERARFQMTVALDTLDERMAAGEGLSGIAAELGVPVLSLMPLDRNGVTPSGARFDTFAAFPQALTQAFQLPLNELSSRFDASGTVLLLSPREIFPTALPEFDTVRETVRRQLMAERLSTATATAIERLTGRIRSGDVSFEAAAEEAGSPLETLPQPVSRLNAQAMGVPGAVLQAAFMTREGDVVALPTGAAELFAVLKVREVIPPSPSVIAGLSANANSDIIASLQADLEIALGEEIRRAVKLRENNAAINAYRQSISGNR